ncbi:general substrate transporter [Aspergillus unguis]
MGYASSIIATTLSQPSWYATMDLATASNSAALIGATNGLFYTGGAFGSIASGFIVNRYGRKKCAAMAALMILISSALITGSVHIGMFITFRFSQGWGSFQMMSTIPMWMAELVPPKNRGLLVQIHPAMINFGYTAASYTGIGFYHYTGGGNDQWRGPLGLAALFPFVLLAVIYWIPESPRYLLANDKNQEAWDILRLLHSSPGDPQHVYAKRELYQIHQQMQLEKSQASGSILKNYIEIFKKPSLRKRALMTMFITFSQMSSGALVINNYGGLIYSSLGFDNASVLQIQGGYQVCGWVMNTASMFIIDRFPRNKLMSFGYCISGITVIVEAALQKNYLGTTDRPGLIACAALLFVNVTCFGLFVEGVGFCYTAEIWPTFNRGEGYGLGMFSLCVTSIIWTQAAPTAFESISWKFYIIFIVFDAIAAVVVWFFPDTLGKPLEEVAVLFGDEDMVAVYQEDLDHAKGVDFDLNEDRKEKGEERIEDVMVSPA